MLWRRPGYRITILIYIVGWEMLPEEQPHKLESKEKWKDNSPSRYCISSYCSSYWLCGNPCLQSNPQNFSWCSSSGEALLKALKSWVWFGLDGWSRWSYRSFPMIQWTDPAAAQAELPRNWLMNSRALCPTDIECQSTVRTWALASARPFLHCITWH